jgi:hypothetical protein
MIAGAAVVSACRRARRQVVRRRGAVTAFRSFELR